MYSHVNNQHRSRGASKVSLSTAIFALIIICIIIYFCPRLFAPNEDWKIFIPIHKADPSIFETVDRRLKIENLLESYKAGVNATLSENLKKWNFQCDISIASFPIPELVITLKAPCNSKSRERIKEIISKAVSAIEAQRVCLFSQVGLGLASEANIIETDIVSSALGDISSNVRQTHALASLTSALEEQQKRIKNQLSLIDKEISRSSKILKKNTNSRKSPNKVTKLVNKRSTLLAETKSIDKKLNDLEEQRRILEFKCAKRIEYERNLLRIDAKNNVLKALFEWPASGTSAMSDDFCDTTHGHGIPNASAITISEPPFFHMIAADFWPVLLIFLLAAAYLYAKTKPETADKNTANQKDASTLGIISKSVLPAAKEIIVSLYKGQPIQVGEIEAIAHNIFLEAQTRHCKHIAVFGIHKGCGTSTVTALIAASLASQRKNVVLLDFDWFEPVQNRLWQIPWTFGTVNITCTINGVFNAPPRWNTYITVIPTGPLPPEPQSAFKIASFEKCMNLQVAQNCDLLLADFGNIENINEALPKVLECFDAIVVTAPSESRDITNLNTLPKAVEKQLLGIVFVQ